MTTTSFALRTFSEFKEAAQALAKVSLWPPGEPGFDLGGQTVSINWGFNSLISGGLSSRLALVEENLLERLATLDIAQEIMRSMLDHPTERYALAINFAEGSCARRVIEANDAANREAEENDGAIVKAGVGLSAAESELWHCFDGHVTLEAVSRALALYQSEVSELSAAKGALQRARETRR
jgi:hypothetical protein